MASVIQIVPKGQYPHVETFIYDNTEVNDTPSTEVDDTIKTIHVFRSGKGIDNKIVKITSQPDFTETFGKTDYKKYGQALMMPYASLASERTSVYCMRLMPDDAAYANSAIYAYYRLANVTVKEPVLDENGKVTYEEDGYTVKTQEVEKQVFQVMFRSASFAPTVNAETNRLENDSTAVIDDKTFDSLIKASIEDIEATDGGENWVCVPLMRSRLVGRGIYGDDYKWRITKNAEYEKDYEKKIYTFEIMSAENGLEKSATYVGSLVTSVVNNESMFIDDIISEYDEGEYPVAINVYEESVEIIYNAYKKFLYSVAKETGEEIVVPDKDEFDLLFGMELNTNTPYEYFQVLTPPTETVTAEDGSVSVVPNGYPVPDDANAIVMGDTIGIPYAGGYDGSFSMFVDTENKTVVNGALETISAADYATAVRNGILHLQKDKVGTRDASTVEDFMYAKAFAGMLDKSILSVRRTPADYLLDANYSYYTKHSFVQFALARNDALVYIDTGVEYDSFTNAVLETLKADYYESIFADRLVSVNAHHMKVSDPFTQKKVVVTMTYYIARNLPVHWAANGIQTPFAKAKARITEHAKNSIYPVIDLHEGDLMETLTNIRVNYVEAIGENQFQRGIQNTAQTIKSDLDEESNVHVLMWLKRNIEKDVFDNLYNFANASERATFRQVEKAKYEFIEGSMVESFDITFDMNEWESQRQILHCYLEVVFRGIAKRAIIEIDVNKRDYTA